MNCSGDTGCVDLALVALLSSTGIVFLAVGNLVSYSILVVGTVLLID